MGISKNGIGRDMRLWPMLSLLLIVVLVPTTCLLWFMNRAIENERLAMSKTLEDAYRRDLAEAQTRLELFWHNRLADLDKLSSGDSISLKTAPAIFARCVRSGWADTVICYDAQDQLCYPAAHVISSNQNEAESADWAEARRLEYSAHDLTAAAKAYLAIAADSSDLNLAARALQAQARCLVQAGDKQSAVNLIENSLDSEKYALTVDSQNRLIVPNAQLMALQLMADQPSPALNILATRLQERLNDYGDSAMSSVQRLFLMQQLKQILGERARLPLLPAEELATRFCELHAIPGKDVFLHSSPLPGVWQIASSNGRLLALFNTDTIIRQSSSAIALPQLPAEIVIEIHPTNVEPKAANAIYSLPAGKYLPNWQMTLSLNEGGLTDVSANRRIAIYLWTGVTVIAAISLLTAFMAQTFRNQMRHTRLKNDLVATVSHELKTPLSSIRLLVDTLLDAKTQDANKTREYLQLIAKENARLSRLIDNFLAFSRMERNKQTFQFAATSLDAIINTAVDAIRERFDRPGCNLEVKIDADLPAITVDADALVTVVLNLLDNAYKYTGDEKHICLKAYQDQENVCISVTDNGIGLSRAAIKRIFARFYQVDRRLSRSAGGCGLGLSIVKFIVNAHAGTVNVTSQPGRGSTFTVLLPKNSSNV